MKYKSPPVQAVSATAKIWKTLFGHKVFWLDFSLPFLCISDAKKLHFFASGETYWILTQDFFLPLYFWNTMHCDEQKMCNWLKKNI